MTEDKAPRQKQIIIRQNAFGNLKSKIPIEMIWSASLLANFGEAVINEN